jgi:hypothetical protein
MAFRPALYSVETRVIIGAAAFVTFLLFAVFTRIYYAGGSPAAQPNKVPEEQIGFVLPYHLRMPGAAVLIVLIAVAVSLPRTWGPWIVVAGCAYELTLLFWAVRDIRSSLRH